MRAATAFAILLAAAPTLGDTPAAVASKRAELSNWTPWLEALDSHSRYTGVTSCTSSDTDSSSYPFLCVAETFVGVSICAAGSGADGCTCTDPLPADFSCSTDTSYASNALYDSDGVQGSAPDCTQLDADLAASTAASVVHEQALNGNLATDAYKQMREATAYLDQAVITGSSVQFGFPHNTGCVLALSPTVGPGAKFWTLDGTTSGAVTAATPAATADIRIYKPTVMAGAATSEFGIGKVMVVGGSNAASISVSQYVTKAELSGLTNTGTMTANGASDLFIADTVNSGSVTVTASTAKLVGITNQQGATVTVSGSGTFELYETSNEAA